MVEVTRRCFLAHLCTEALGPEAGMQASLVPTPGLVTVNPALVRPGSGVQSAPETIGQEVGEAAVMDI